ncbi:hypothetical protein IscW_ISCW022755 [Ixodes scapularis]|uniref:Uncharacterized protein n=1 Tax=Ixodes scapularis TaxID=6945 RepID=B7QG56_IXOSC|nr:hypothetical protein IscW_ISCW022755 [Ixodes scapularis]|eukprot:XP_002401177.1 hypothetical protein IscW_ISCW022755 [Ixodes scapularis]
MSKTDLTKKADLEAEKLAQRIVFPGKQLSEFVIRFPGPEQTVVDNKIPRPVSFEVIIGPQGATIVLPEPERQKKEPQIVHIIRECCCGGNHDEGPEREGAAPYDDPKSGYRTRDDHKHRVGYQHRDDYCQWSEEEPRQPQMQNTRAEYQPCSARDCRTEHRASGKQKSANQIYTEQVARNAWANYEKEFKRYQAALAEWDYQQDLVRKKLGMTRSGRGSATQETVKSTRPPDSLRSLEPKMAPKPADQPTTIRIGLSGNKIHKIEPQKSSTEGLRPQFTRMSLNDYGQR